MQSDRINRQLKEFPLPLTFAVCRKRVVKRLFALELIELIDQ